MANHRFSEWVSAQPSRKAVAVQLGVSESTIEKLIGGRRHPGLALALEIEKATALLDGGPILAREWVRDDQPSDDASAAPPLSTEPAAKGAA